MGPFRRISLFVWLLFQGVPLPRLATLVLPAAFAGAWTLLWTAGVPGQAAFVWAAVLGQSLMIWVNLPRTVARVRRERGRARPGVTGMLVVMLGLAALQVWIGAPWVSQRVLTGFIAVFLFAHVIALFGDRDFLDFLAPRSEELPAMDAFQRSYVMLRAVFCAVIIVVNEGLLVLETELGARVAVLSLLPVVLHYLFWVTARLTLPYPDEES